VSALATGRALDGRGWDAYLVAAVALTPFVAGIAGTPLAWPDLVNLLALAVFAATVLVHRVRLETPLLMPVLLVATGSVLAVADAASITASALTLAQDAYLYLWSVALVALLRRRGEMRVVRRVAVAAALLVALACLAESWRNGVHGVSSLLSPSGHRSSATFGNANLCADFLLLGVFMLLSLEPGRLRAWTVAGVALLSAGILTTKSNGPLFALAAGLAAWAAWRAHAHGIPARRLAANGALGAALLLLLVWLVSETGFGGSWFRAVEEHTMFARVAHSTETRGRIWERLERRVSEHPLGIGPGNSSAGDVEIGERERKGTLRSKEAHSDYLGYAVERGPLGLAGLFIALATLGTRVLRGRGALDARAGDPRRGAAMHAACVGAFVAMLVQSTVIEQLHFRHVWWVVAWMWAATGPVAVASASRAARPLAGAPSPRGVPA
jgi:hypothetical protein